MKTVTIGFSKSKKKFAFGSWLIRWYMKTEYSHTYLSFYSNHLSRDLKYEAVGGGVRFVGQKEWESHAEEICKYSIQVTDKEYIELLQYCIDNAGADYGFMQNMGIVLANVLKLNKNIWRKGQNCSELVGRLLELKGYIFCKDLNLLTPNDIEKALQVKQPYNIAKELSK
jgi:hypothetical protein